MGKQFAYWNTVPAVLPKLPRRLKHGADIVELRRRHFHLDRLTVLLGQPRLGIKRIDLRWTSIHEKEDHVLGLRFELRRPGLERILIMQIGARP